MNVSDALLRAANAQAEILISEIGGAIAIVISTSDGFEVAARSQNAAQISRMAAMASSIAAIGSVIGQESRLGAHRSITIDADSGFVIMVEIRHPVTPLTLSVITTRSAILGQALFAANRAASELVTAAA